MLLFASHCKLSEFSTSEISPIPHQCDPLLRFTENEDLEVMSDVNHSHVDFKTIQIGLINIWLAIHLESKLPMHSRIFHSF